ncbi:MAG: hypothetical protein K2X81_09250 [Candidatus Obscuribacterales bacterium]|nr:hypothetical protein [Candidatus Obscuribacterales bacterium]
MYINYNNDQKQEVAKLRAGMATFSNIASDDATCLKQLIELGQRKTRLLTGDALSVAVADHYEHARKHNLLVRDEDARLPFRSHTEVDADHAIACMINIIELLENYSLLQRAFGKQFSWPQQALTQAEIEAVQQLNQSVNLAKNLVAILLDQGIKCAGLLAMSSNLQRTNCLWLQAENIVFRLERLFADFLNTQCRQYETVLLISEDVERAISKIKVESAKRSSERRKNLHWWLQQCEYHQTFLDDFKHELGTTWKVVFSDLRKKEAQLSKNSAKQTLEARFAFHVETGSYTPNSPNFRRYMLTLATDVDPEKGLLAGLSSPDLVKHTLEQFNRFYKRISVQLLEQTSKRTTHDLVFRSKGESNPTISIEANEPLDYYDLVLGDIVHAPTKDEPNGSTMRVHFKAKLEEIIPVK